MAPPLLLTTRHTGGGVGQNTTHRHGKTLVTPLGKGVLLSSRGTDPAHDGSVWAVQERYPIDAPKRRITLMTIKQRLPIAGRRLHANAEDKSWAIRTPSPNPHGLEINRAGNRVYRTCGIIGAQNLFPRSSAYRGARSRRLRNSPLCVKRSFAVNRRGSSKRGFSNPGHQARPQPANFDCWEGRSEGNGDQAV